MVATSQLTETISTAFPFESKFLSVKGSSLHYIDEGQGNPVLFIHGLPFSNYIWRNIIPALSAKARCIAPDLIGIGQSAKPGIAYSLFDHIDYITDFIDALGLKDITLVLHSWGAAIGLAYAMRHPSKVKAVAFYEAHLAPFNDWDMLSLPMQELLFLLENINNSKTAIMEQNYFIEQLLPQLVLRKLSPVEHEVYRQAYATPDSRKALWQYTQELPLGEEHPRVNELISGYTDWLQHTGLPKLVLYTIPGYITTVAQLQWCKDHLDNLTLIDLGEALHTAQETVPHAFSRALADWYNGVVNP